MTSIINAMYLYNDLVCNIPSVYNISKESRKESFKIIKFRIIYETSNLLISFKRNNDYENEIEIRKFIRESLNQFENKINKTLQIVIKSDKKND